MTNRDRAIKQAFEEGFRAGYYCAEPDELGDIVNSYAVKAFEPWARNHADLVDHVPGIHSRLNELEAKLAQMESQKQGTRKR